MNKSIHNHIGKLLCIYVVFVTGCASLPPGLQIKNSLALNRLETFNEGFSDPRWDLWEKMGLMFSDNQVEKMKLADMKIVKGELVITTKPGYFSKGGLASTFKLQGDFDVQLDCRVDFIQGPVGLDQFVAFGVYQKKENKNMNLVQIGLIQKQLYSNGHIFSNEMKDGSIRGARGKRISSFDGTFRLVRIDDQVTTLYRKRFGAKWIILSKRPFTADDAHVGFKVQNFVAITTWIKSESSFTVVFDDFRINAARGIVESEI